MEEEENPTVGRPMRCTGMTQRKKKFILRTVEDEYLEDEDDDT